MSVTDTATAWPVIALHDVTPEDVTASLGGGSPTVAIGLVRIGPVRAVNVDMWADLDALDGIADAVKARTAELRRMLASTEPAALRSHDKENDQ